MAQVAKRRGSALVEIITLSPLSWTWSVRVSNAQWGSYRSITTQSTRMTEESFSLGKHLWAWRSFLILLLGPILLLPIPVVIGNSEARCAYVVLLMALYWVSEAMPVSVTALLPVVLFPILDIATSDETVVKYMNDVNMLFICGLIVAVAIEYWNLHKRIALRILMIMGSEPRWLMLGLMLATWFLSMWISNTATTAMMVPIADAVLQQLKVTDGQTSDENGHLTGTDKRSSDVSLKIMGGSEKSNDVTKESNQSKDKALGQQEPANDVDGAMDQSEGEEPEDRQFSLMTKGMSLCICYAANSGGIASLTGTGPNLVLKGQADEMYERVGLKNPVNFGSWMAFGLPLSAIIVFVCWIWLNIAFLRCRGGCSNKQSEDQKRRVKAVIKDEYVKLGPIVFGQAVVMVMFVLLVTLWVTRDLGGVAGWGYLFPDGVKDSMPAAFVAILLFALPSTLPCLASYADPAHPEKEEENGQPSKKLVIRPILPWKIVHQKMPWSLLLLLGGGFAVSHGCKVSGLSVWVGSQLDVFSHWNQWLMLLIICYITTMATEVTSNTAISQLFLPIMAQLSVDTNQHPLYFMFPVALACSFAFMLPVATPPNAIVFAFGRVRIMDMALAGTVMNLLTVPILVAVTGTVGDAIFDFSNIPEEFLNQTLAKAAESVAVVTS